MPRVYKEATLGSFSDQSRPMMPKATSLLLVVFLAAVASASVNSARNFNDLDPSNFPVEGVDNEAAELKAYRNLALSRLVKRAIENMAANIMPGEEQLRQRGGAINCRSGSKTPQWSALWKTRVG